MQKTFKSEFRSASKKDSNLNLDPKKSLNSKIQIQNDSNLNSDLNFKKIQI